MFGREPALILAFVQAALALLVGFGLELTAEQVALILGFAAAVLGVITRRQVTPNSKVALTHDDVAALEVAERIV